MVTIEGQVEGVLTQEDGSAGIKKGAEPSKTTSGSVVSGVIAMRGAVIVVYEVQE